MSPERPFLPLAGRGLSSKIARGGWDLRTPPPWTSCATAGLSRPQCFPLKMRLRCHRSHGTGVGAPVSPAGVEAPMAVAVGLFKKIRRVWMGSQLPQGGCHPVPSFCSVFRPHGDNGKCAHHCPGLFQAARCTCFLCPQHLWEEGLSWPHSADEPGRQTWNESLCLSEPRRSGVLCVILYIIACSLWWHLSLCHCALSTEEHTEALACPGVGGWGGGEGHCGAQWLTGVSGH